ncbi:oligosaccharyltransferase alpha subunit [Coniophora puteana RWD-64-598 SS2]|uniref:Dolichyl-diphosphooligosaccharide--protein glycosyltransferase subunit 1 n=1 Tax=Coniophora puteana (strain RWD-64-598) TaxID=741705 RepID=A0A5M3MAU2_CONPW|nr:oligosaccharyltransferase alpha subunit [Coniophora puteana RWD-64-598 SS2]EIW76106.1 oligosaccharyltransferase alpha subunit [Coniophora puteana RWD-64-598 SS2]
MARWASLSWLILGLSSPLVWAGPAFENSAIVRTVDLGGSLVHVTTTYAVRALEAGQTAYQFALANDEWKKTSWTEVKVKGQQNTLPLVDVPQAADSDAHLFAVTLPRNLAVNDTIHLVLDTVQTHATYPWPEKAGQKDPQLLKYDAQLFILSPYQTQVQRTKVKSSSPNIISYTTPEGAEQFAKDEVVTKSGTTLTYGPYANIDPSVGTGFVRKHQKSINVHYSYDYPVLEVKKLQRFAEISHWGSNLNIEDKIELRNSGPALKGHFSRIEHQSSGFYHSVSPHVVNSLTLHLPAGIHDAYYYDLNGNVSTSRLRTVPSVAKNSKANQYSIFEMRPRYPVLGGWNYTFTLGWDSPLADSVSYDSKEEKYIVGVPVWTLIPGAVVNDAEVKIVLPEGATDVQFISPFPSLSEEISTHVTYLDTTGRPAVSLDYKDLTDKHTGMIYVSYKVPLSAHLKKPVAVAAAFFSLFFFALTARRVDLRLHKE